MVAGLHACCNFVCCKHCTDRNAAAKALCECHDIRLDAVVLIAEHLACTADTCLHLVDDEKNALLDTELLNSLDVFEVCRMNAALALNELEHDRCSLGINSFDQSVDVVIRNMNKAGEIRFKRPLELSLARCGNCTHGPSVEAHVCRDDLVLVNILIVEITSCELDGCFVGLSAGIAEEYLICKTCAAEPVCKLRLLWNVIVVAGMDDVLSLVADS